MSADILDLNSSLANNSTLVEALSSIIPVELGLNRADNRLLPRSAVADKAIDRIDKFPSLDRQPMSIELLKIPKSAQHSAKNFSDPDFNRLRLADFPNPFIYRENPSKTIAAKQIATNTTSESKKQIATNTTPESKSVTEKKLLQSDHRDSPTAKSPEVDDSKYAVPNSELELELDPFSPAKDSQLVQTSLSTADYIAALFWLDSETPTEDIDYSSVFSWLDSLENPVQKPPGVSNPNDPILRQDIPKTIPKPLDDSSDESLSPGKERDTLPLSPTTPANPNYIVSPRSLESQKVDPLLTQVIVNNLAINHRSQYQIGSGLELGNGQTTNVGLNATGFYSPSIEESMSKDRIYRLDYRNVYAQIGTIRQRRDINTTLIDPETLLGMRQQMSFVGSCLNNNDSNTANNNNQICNYLSGLSTDNNSIDPQQQVPTRFIQGAKFGEIVTPESLAAMRQPGFQSGANGQELGLDLYFPKVGTRMGNSQATNSRAERLESSRTVPTLSFGRVRQAIATNGTQTQLVRTVRGFNVILGDRNSWFNTGIQAITELLPDLLPSVSPNPYPKERSNTVNRNLFLAANNNRIPDNSFTAYSVGVGIGNTPGENQILAANYHGFWVGFSPVIERNISTSKVYQTTGPQRITINSGAETGLNGNANMIATINNNSFNSNEINNAYTQNYLTMYERDADVLNRTVLQEQTNYYPHLSASGNITTKDSVLRYYSGVVFNPTNAAISQKIYGGIDFNKVESNGWSYSIGGIGYINPDPEYYSHLRGNVAKNFKLGNGNSLSLSTGLNYAFDGDSIYDSFNFRSGNSHINFISKANLGNVSLGVTYFMPNGMPNPINQLLLLNGEWRINNWISSSIYYTPINQNTTRSTLGVSTNFRINSGIATPIISLSWNRKQSDFITPNGNKAGINDDVFGAYIRFGEL